MGRYFGRDITNLENNQLGVRDISQPQKSSLKTSGRDMRVKPTVKATPLQFYKDIIKNQRLLHKRSATNDNNKSGSVDLKDSSKIKRPVDTKDLFNDGAKQRLNNFLKFKSKTGAWLPQDLQQDNQIVIQEFNCEKAPENNFAFKSSKEPKPQSFSERFASIPQLMPSALQHSRVAGIAKYTPTNNANITKLQNSDLHRPEKNKVDRSSRNFQHLRLNLEDQKASPRKDHREKTVELKSEQKEAIENELDRISARSLRACLRRQFDIPFIWEYLLVQEVVRRLP